MPTNEGVLTGMHNKVGDNKFWIPLDYDYLTLEQVKKECRELIEEYKLSHFYIYESTPCKYHVVNFTVVDRETYESILEHARCDVGHAKTFENRGNATIRVSKKVEWPHPPKHLDTVESPYPSKEKHGLKQAYTTLVQEEQHTEVTQAKIVNEA